LPALRAAEWRDRADAAVASVDELDLRDLRSVVVAAESGARDDEARALAEQLRSALARRVDEEQVLWLNELAGAVRDGRVVRALRLSSRPPKAGSQLPPELSEALVVQASENLTSDTSVDRWMTVIDALSFSPVRASVTPASVPDPLPDEVKAAVAKAATHLPHIAALLGVEAAPRRSRSRRPPAKAPATGSPAAAIPAPPPPPDA
jgi:hypothetical protein